MQAPQKTSYDVVIVGGAMFGSSLAWWLSKLGFAGSVLVVERDPTYEWCSTAHTNSCIRQQFTSPLNIKISQFGAAFVKGFRDFTDDDRVPQPVLQNFGYMYLARDPDFAAGLKAAQQVQTEHGASTRHMTAAKIKETYPFYHLDDIIAGNHNTVDEGYFDGNTLFDWWKRLAREGGVEYAHNAVVGMDRQGDRIASVTLQTGEVIACGMVVNCSGPRAVLTCRMAGLEIPVEPRKRYTFVFEAAAPLDRDLPLTIDPSGVHMRSDGRYYMAGCPPDDDHAVDYDDFNADHSIWEDKVWPAIAHRVPAFERVKLRQSWVGHYAYNTFDQNAILGPHPAVPNFILCNGFSGHGFQQSPAIGRGLAEFLTHGTYQTLDLTPFHIDRIIAGQKFEERAVI